MLEKLGVANEAAAGQVPDTVRYAFYAGAGVLLGAIVWTVLGTREYPPETLHAFDEAPPLDRPPLDRTRITRFGTFWFVFGVVAIALVLVQGLPKELLLLGGLLGAYGLALLLLNVVSTGSPFATVMTDIYAMPVTMRRLALVQFFSWFALFAMWIYTTATVTGTYYGTDDPKSAAFNEGANWVGVLFAAYNGFAALAAAVIPFLVRRFGLRVSHLINVSLGGLGLISIPFMPDAQWLLLSMVGVGFAWASILSMPYALLSDSVPAQKMGVYMGIFNFFIVIPQLVAVATLGYLLHAVFGNHPANLLILGGASMILSGLLVLRVPEPKGH
jgi:maltose/moltooligosaccharide transporter